VRSPDFVDTNFRAGPSGNSGACSGAAACTLTGQPVRFGRIKIIMK
jgi:hypothetical protein